MGNKIDGGQSGFERFTDAAAGFFGMDEAETCKAQPAAKKAEAKVDPSASDPLDDIPEAPSGFLDALSGTVAKAGADIAATVSKAGSDIVDTATDAVGEVAQAAGESALATVAETQQAIASAKRDVDLMADVVTHVATKTGEQMLSDASEALNEVAEIPEELDAAGQELFVKAEEVRVELAQELDRAIENHPPDVVAEAVEDALEGAWDIAGDIAIGYVNSQVEGALSIANAVADIYVTVDEVSGAAKKALFTEVITAGCEFVVKHGEVTQEAGALVESVFDNKLVNGYVKVMDFSTMGALSGAQQTILKLANAAQISEDQAQKLLNSPETIALMAGGRSVEEVAGELEKLPVGHRLHEKKGSNISVHKGVGGEVGGATTASVQRTGEQEYQVTLNLEILAGFGVGLEKFQEGLSLDFVTKPGGEIVLQFEGADAAENAARVMAATSGEMADLLRLRDVTGGEIVEATGTFIKPSVALNAFDLGMSRGVEASATYKNIDGEDFVGLSVAASFDVSLGGDSLQVRDKLAEDWLNDSNTGNPAVDGLLSEFPDGFGSDLKSIYGPYSGVSISGEPQISASFLRRADGTGPIRAEFDVGVELSAGRSTLKANIGFAVPDIGKLADALQMNVESLSTSLRNGEISVQELMQSGSEIASLIELKGPKIVLEQADMNAISMFGQTWESGTIRPYILVDHPKTIDHRARLHEALDSTDNQSVAEPNQLGAQAQNDLLLAHATSMRS